MEKKVNKRFYYLSALNLITCFVLGEGLTYNTLVFIGFLGVLILNHTALINMVGALTSNVSAQGDDAKPTLGKVLFLFFLKLMILALAMGFIYLYKKELISKLLILMIFQLIIQVLSIKNNYQIS